MQNQINHRSLSLLVALALLAPASTALAFEEPEVALAAETFGTTSGDVPLRGLGLVLELVQSNPEVPALRLFGGVPGHPATVLLSSERQAAPLAGVRDVRFLIGGPNVRTIQGSFDGSGSFEVPLAALASLGPDARVYAQGMHTGLIEWADGVLVQASHGIEIRRAVAEEMPFVFDDLLPHLPAERELGSFADLAGLLQTALDSAGDSLSIGIEIDGSVGLGIEIVDAKVGAKVAFDFSVTRTAEGLYELAIASDVAALVGFGAGAGAEVGIEGSGGVGGTTLYRFHSAPGAARGILGVALASAFPALAPDTGLLQSGGLGDAGQRMAELQSTLATLREHREELEAFLWEVIDVRLDEAEQGLARAKARLAAARSALASCLWYQRPAKLVEVGARQVLVAVATVGLNAAHTARTVAESALDAVQVAMDANRDALLALGEGLAHGGRIVSAVAQLQPYALEHCAAEEFRSFTALELEAKVGLPVVDIGGLESGVSEEMKRTLAVRIERATESQPSRMAVVVLLEREKEATLGLVAGASAARARTIEIAQEFELGSGGWQLAGGSLGLAVDTQATYGAGAFVTYEQGVGREWSVVLSDDTALWQAGSAAVTSIDALVETVGALGVDLELQDRRQKSVGFAFAIDVTGNGGGIEIEATWKDQGRALARATTVAQAVEQVLNGAAQVIDATDGTVAILP